MAKLNVAENAATSEVKPNEEKSKKGENNVTSKKVAFYKLFSFADSTDKALMIIGSIGAIGNGLTMPLMAVLLGNLVDVFGQNQNNKHIMLLVSEVSLKYIYLAIGAGVAAFLQVTCWMVTGERQAARIRNLYLKAILRQEIAFFDKQVNTGEVVARMSGDTIILQDAMGEKVGQFIQLISTFVSGFAIAFIRGWRLTAVMLSVLPVIILAGALMTIFVSEVATKGQNSYNKAATVADQTIGSIRTVASFTGEEQATRNYYEAIGGAYKSGVLEGMAAGTGFGIVMFVMYSSYALAIWYGSRMVLQGSYTGGTVISIIVAELTASLSLGQASPSLSAFTAGQVAAYKLFETINRKPEIDPYDLCGKVLDDIRGDIELKDVYFSYPTRPDEHIFSGFSLSVDRGTSVALVGESGSGKSTVISLVERFYDPQSGEVLIDGINIKEFQVKWIREKIGLVSQEPVLFGSSIKDNIAYGKDGATDEEIRTAVELANAAKFIDKLPQGLDTLVGDHGTQLSGGQKQRVALARAILKDPRILLLDEATSALDVESERIVQEALDNLMGDRTTIVVAHRLSTVRNVDVIAVIHQGKVVEKGPYSELIAEEGAFAQLVRLQQKGEVSEQAREGHPELSNQGQLALSSPGQRSSSMVNRISQASKHNPESGLPEAETVSVSPSKQLPAVSFKRLACLSKPEIPAVIIGSLAGIVNGISFPMFGILFSSVIKMFFKSADELRKESRFWALMYVVLGVASLISSPSRSYFFAVAGCKLIRRIRTMCFEKVVNMEIGWFDEPENSSGIIGARLSTDAANVRGLVGDTLGLLVQNIATTIAGLVIGFLANGLLTIIILAMIPLLGCSGYFQLKFVEGFSDDTKRKYEEASQVAKDAVESIRTVASFSAEEKIIQLYEIKCRAPMEAGIKRGLVSGFGFGLSSSLLFCVYAVSFYVGAQLVGRGKATFSEVFRVFFALSMAALGLSQTTSFLPDIGKAKSAVASIFAILDRQSKIDPSDKSGTTLEQVDGEIEFRHVKFKYPTRPRVLIFRDLCLTINPGKTVALIGESGSGKSTAVSLLQRFYDPESGCITLDGTDIRNFQLKWLRRQMGLVSQEPILFNDTIGANIAFGKGTNVTEAEIIVAAKLANAHNFISSLQQGYDTIVGERGVQLSGGQKQRVAIARAILMNPKILLLDEATSALDAESEKIVQESLDKVMLNRTTIIVAHRLSTIKNANIIAVVKNGIIAENGNHEDLINIQGGLYATLLALHMTAIS
ncbi:ABC transporter B family member 11-like [Silene latifolia]|uniref:ABC transporter B family member 11-like n=1 Tax=Silene latifolia TaxID=37657 RepID=UPI003D777FE7